MRSKSLPFDELAVAKAERLGLASAAKGFGANDAAGSPAAAGVAAMYSSPSALVRHWHTLRRAAAFVSLALILFLVLSGCAQTNHGDEHAGHTADGHSDNIEITSSPDILPSFLDDYTQTTKDYYDDVYAHQDILKELNCYCGCMEYNDPHDSLYRCFIAGIDDNGVHWTDHGGSCGVCLMELRDAVKLADEGKTILEIQAHIDATYGGAA